MTRNQKGQGILEYLILASLIGIISLVAIKSFGDRLKTRIEWMSKKVEQHITQ